ncbi:MAG TPA: T9SS type A sorting domain-containing protein [Saprospiraceae bacterium]|nr:T9SS type A sorting domain-containing protein [Saprospiraceae bacterium]
MHVLADMIQSDIITRSIAFDAKINSLPIWMSKLIERKFVWHMEQKLLRSGSSTALTNSEWDQLRIIANTCPLEGGKAVYEAQALLSVIGEIDFPQYNVACQPVTPRVRSNDVGTDDIAKISPNPTTGIINIAPNIDGVYTISIQDISGRMLLTKENSGYLSIDLSTFMSGLYFYTITSDTKSQSGKVILVK